MLSLFLRQHLYMQNIVLLGDMAFLLQPIIHFIRRRRKTGRLMQRTLKQLLAFPDNFTSEAFRISWISFISLSQSHRWPEIQLSIRLKRAMDLLKEEFSAVGLMESSHWEYQYYKVLETWLERWSSEFQSKTNPTKEEIDHFYAYKAYE